MKRILIPAAVAALLALGACEQAAGIGIEEPVQIEEPAKMKYPVSVEQARAAAAEHMAAAVSAETDPDEEIQKDIVPEEAGTEMSPTQMSGTSEPDSAEGAAAEPAPEQPAGDLTQIEIMPQESETVEVAPDPEPVQDSCFGEDTQYGTYYEDCYDVPDMIPMGVYHVTHYSAEACGNAIGAGRPDGGLVEGTSIAMPDPALLGCWVYVEGYGTYRVDDISPAEADIFHWYESDAVGEDWRQVYLIVEG